MIRTVVKAAHACASKGKGFIISEVPFYGQVLYFLAHLLEGWSYLSIDFEAEIITLHPRLPARTVITT